MALQALFAREGITTGPIDGRFGCRTKKALKTFLKTKGYEVGCCGRKTTKALQQYLRDQGVDPGPIDGVWDCRTNRALQTALNTVLAKPTVVVDAVLSKEPLDVKKAMPVASGKPLKEPLLSKVTATEAFRAA